MDAKQALRDVRSALLEEAVQIWNSGGPRGLHEAPFLLAFLRQLTTQGWAFEKSILRSGAETSEAILRGVRVPQESTRSPHQRGLEGQSTREYTDALRVLSSILARHAQTAWVDAFDAYAEVGFPLGVNSAGRVVRLRGYGDGIVAQAAAAFVTAYLESTR